MTEKFQKRGSGLLKSTLLLLFLISLSGCLFNNDAEPGYKLSTLSLPLILQSSQCGDFRRHPSAEILQGDKQILPVFQKLHTGEAMMPLSANTRAIWIKSGQKPTAGYTLILQPTAQLANHTLSLWVDENRPSLQVKSAQVITSPCVLALLPKANYDRIQVQGGLSLRPIPLTLK